MSPRIVHLALWFFGTRLLALLGMVAGTFIQRPQARYPYWVGDTGSFFWQQVPYRILDVWGRWDTMYYVGLAHDGYPASYPEGGWVFHAAYFPLFPTMMRGLAELLGGISVFYAGILLANSLLFLAVVYLDKLVRLDRSEAFAGLVVACALAYPGSHFLSCVYPESTALFLGVFALYCARTHKPWVAGLACGLAVLTRSSGVLICLPALYELCRREDGTVRPSLKMFVLLIPVGSLLLLLGLHWQTYGDPLYFVHVQSAWGRKPTFPLEPLFRFNLTPDYHLLALWVVAALWWGFRRRLRPGYLALLGANVLLPLTTGLLNGIHRYMASNFPLFLVTAEFLETRPRWRRGYLIAGLLCMGFLAFRWGQGHRPN